MRKIFVAKEDTAAAVVEKIIAEPDTEFALIVPKNAALGDSADNFRILKREAEALGKTILVESIDESVLRAAKAAKIESAHSLFDRGNRERSLSDIIPPQGAAALQSSSGRRQRKAPKAKEKEGEKKPENAIHLSVAESATAEISEHESDAIEKKFERSDEDARGLAAKPISQKSRHRRKAVMLGIVTLIVSVGVLWGFGKAFGRADITIHFKKTPWQYDGMFTATKTIAKPDAAKNLFPAEVFREERNITKLFPATGRATVNQKAIGKITIYNGYNTAPQPLVATTRFETADGKIFRLDKAVVVPGAALKSRKIIPSSIAADVTAEKSGGDYDRAPSVDHLAIPGFKGSSRYAGFYGVLAGGASGGAASGKLAPTPADIASAKAKTEEILRSALTSKLLNSPPSGVTIIPGASDIAITKMAVNSATDANGNFSVFGTAEFRAIGFREPDIQNFLGGVAVQDRASMTVKNLTIAYENPKPNFDRGELAVHVRAQGNVVRAFNVGEFRASILGRSVGDARARILGLSDLSDAKISLWPFWLSRVPKNLKKINIAGD